MSNLELRPHGRGRSPFDDLRHIEDDGTEWWSAREMMPQLGYERWENLENAIERAKAACRNTGAEVSENFRDATKVLGRRGPGSRDVQMIAAAQRYFAIQTRRAEIHLSDSKPSKVNSILLPWSQRLSQTFQRHRLFIVQRFPPGSFSTYTATMGEILMIEDELARHQIPLKYGDLPDGSIGRRWSIHRKEQGLAEPIGHAPLEMPHLQINVEPFVYAATQLPNFFEWLNQVYIPENMPDYFSNKPDWKKIKLSAASAADHASLRLTGKPALLGDQQRKALQAAGGFVPVKALPDSRK